MCFPKKDVYLQPLCAVHAQAMCALEQACFTLPWSAAQCRAAFAQPAFVALGLFRAGQLLGYLSMYHIRAELEILNLAVAPAERRQGYARRLLETILRKAPKMGMQKALLEVRAGNGPAISLYESCGFVKVGLRRNYYADTGESALLYVRTLQKHS